MKLATWNVNSIRARKEAVAEWLSRTQPDVLCMQETKVVDEAFPTEEFTRLGYSLVTTGQPTYNGVAIASRLSIKDVCVDLPGPEPDLERRLIAATIAGIRVVNVYVPNGRAVHSPSFHYKLEWFRRLRAWLDATARPEDNLVLCGDFNVAAENRDVYDPVRLDGHILFHPDERLALSNVVNFGLVDTFRQHHQEGGQYTWWDYRAGAMRLNRGLRIDYVFTTEPLAKRCPAAFIDDQPRRGARPSDHVPVVVELEVS